MQVAKQLLAFGAHPDKPGGALLHTAAASGRLEVVRPLIQHGADLKLAGNLGYTALHHAAMWAHEAVIRLLLERGDDPNRQTSCGRMPLHILSSFNQDRLQHGPGNAASFDASELARASRAICSILYAHGADPRVKDKMLKAPPLHTAVTTARWDVVQGLLQHERAADMLEAESFTPLKHGRNAAHNGTTAWVARQRMQKQPVWQ